MHLIHTESIKNKRLEMINQGSFLESFLSFKSVHGLIEVLKDDLSQSETT